jgi:uncharacterized membrane protein
MKEESIHADKVQLAYAGILGKATTLGIAIIIAGYAIYVFQLIPLSVPIEQVAGNWHLRAAEFHQQLDAPLGWSCLGAPGYGDTVSYITLLYLGIVTMLCLFVAGIAFFREKNGVYTAISFVQLLVLIFAAAGIVSGGH